MIDLCDVALARRTKDAARIAELEQQLAEKEDQLVSVLHRKAATAKRHADRTDKLERQLAEARDQALEEAAIEVVKPSHMAPSEAHAAAEIIRAMKGAKP